MTGRAAEQITREQAIALCESRVWEQWTPRQRAEFQLRQERLAMPFDVFHAAVEASLGRSVWTHEFGMNWDGLIAELDGLADPPSMAEIIAMIPREKAVVFVVDAGAPAPRCSDTCDGPGPDVADMGPNAEDGVAIPCPKCGRRDPA